MTLRLELRSSTKGYYALTLDTTDYGRHRGPELTSSSVSGDYYHMILHAMLASVSAFGPHSPHFDMLDEKDVDI